MKYSSLQKQIKINIEKWLQEQTNKQPILTQSEVPYFTADFTTVAGSGDMGSFFSIFAVYVNQFGYGRRVGMSVSK